MRKRGPVLANQTETVIWDFNGTLIDDIELVVRSVNVQLSRRRLPRLTIGRYRDVFRFPVEAYCRDCTRCREACEGGAIPDGKSEVRGFEKYTIDPMKCLPVFARTDGCGLCISKCAFNKRAGEMGEFLRSIE